MGARQSTARCGSPRTCVVVTTWTRVCWLDDLSIDVPAAVTIDKIEVCLVRTCGSVFAVRDRCTHGDVPLSEGEVDRCAVECWLHGSRFDLRSGSVLNPPATKALQTFPVELSDGWVTVGLP